MHLYSNPTGVAGLKILVEAYTNIEAYLGICCLVLSSSPAPRLIRSLSESYPRGANGGRKEGRKEEKHRFNSEMNFWGWVDDTSSLPNA